MCYVLFLFFCFPVFKFSEVNFKSFLDIPSSLLRSIALCFRDKEVVCRKCFYGERSLSTKSSSQSGGEVTLCSEGEHKWLKPVVVIPGEISGRVTLLLLCLSIPMKF